MRVLVCGGRDFNQPSVVNDVLDKLHVKAGIECIIHGDADGADTCASNWAYRRLIEHFLFVAEWSKHGISAGRRRNAKMLKEGKPNVVIAFPGGAGTADMVRRARAAKVDVVIIEVTVKIFAPKKLKRFFA